MKNFVNVHLIAGTTKGVDVFEKLMAFINVKNGQCLDLKNKLFSVTTDDAPAMLGKNVSFVKLLKNWFQRLLLSFY